MQEEVKPSVSSTIDILYAVAIKVLDKQIDDGDSLDSKVRGMLTFVTLIFGALATFISSQQKNLTPVSISMFWFVLLIFIAVVVFSVLAYNVKGRKYLIRGYPLTGIEELGYSDYLVKSYLVRRLGEQHEYNDAILAAKAKYVSFTLWLSFLELLLILGLLLFQIRGNILEPFMA